MKRLYSYLRYCLGLQQSSLQSDTGRGEKRKSKEVPYWSLHPQRCEFCKWYANRRGDCRRHAPTGQGQWPIVLKEDWCGDFELNDIVINDGAKYCDSDLNNGV